MIFAFGFCAGGLSTVIALLILVNSKKRAKEDATIQEQLNILRERAADEKRLVDAVNDLCVIIDNK